MRYLLLIMVVSAAFIAPSTAQKKVNRQYFINLLNAGEYDKVFDSATKLRKEIYGKNAVVDYFIAKSLCLDGQQKNAKFCFNCIIRNFKLSGKKKTFIEEEISSCISHSDEQEGFSASNPDYSYINNISLPEASVGGKMGKVYDCYNGSQTINLTRMVSPEELESRLFPVDRKADAMKKISNLVGTQYKIDTARRYVFVTLKTYPLNKVAYAAESLEKAYRFFIQFYSLRPPDKLLTVYILPSQDALRKTAEIVHGVELPVPNIGYSNLSDLSLLGLGDASHLGTLYHELFHLMVRTDIGDIPAFLDEGLASLYSVSSWKKDTLVGDYRPWRLIELREARYSNDQNLQIPALMKLINYSWEEFDGMENKNICQVAVNYSLSNFIMIYLQEKGLLQKMVTAFKNRPFVPLDSTEAKSNLQIFEEVVKDSINNFSPKFEKWFKEKYSFSLYKDSEDKLRTVKLSDLFEQAQTIMNVSEYEIFQNKNREAFQILKKEFSNIEKDYYALPLLGNNNMNVPPSNNVQQNIVENPAQVKRNEIERRLIEFDKKLRQLIFETVPKKAN